MPRLCQELIQIKHGVITNEVFTPLMTQAPWYELRSTFTKQSADST